MVLRTWSLAARAAAEEAEGEQRVGGPALDARSGSLSRAIGNGSNTVIFLYDLELADNVAPNSSITNTASVTKYANSEGGPDYTDPSSTSSSQTTEVLPQTGDPFDTANTLVINPAIVKTLTATDLTTEGNASNQATIGELATYTVTVTVPAVPRVAVMVVAFVSARRC